MKLFSLVVEHAGNSYATQVNASTAEGAVALYFREQYPHVRRSAFSRVGPELEAKHVMYVKPLDGLENIWSACAGQCGEYISLFVALTESRELPNNSSKPTPLRGAA